MEKNVPTELVKQITRRDLLMIDPKLIVADENFNVRQDYGKIDELKNSIIENGVKQPLRGFRDKDNNHFRLTDGFRRHAAVMKAISEGCSIKKIPFVLEEKGYTNEQRLIDMFIMNSGKNLTPLEEGELFIRLENYGWARKDIARKIGKTEAHISNMILVSQAPMFVKNQVSSNVMSATTASELLRATKNDENRQREIIEEAKAKAQTEGSDRVTNKHISIISDKKNNRKVNTIVSILKSTMEDLSKDDNYINNNNPRIEAFSEIIKFLESEIKLKDLVSFLKYKK